jgi:hypothetical protein
VPARGAPGESDAPQGVVNTTDGRVVRAFHRFTLVDQTGQGRDLTKGRRRDQGAVKISCARQARAARPPGAGCPLTGLALRSWLPAPGPHAVAARPQDPNARNCHGYRKFVKRSVLENPSSGYLVADTIIMYTIELVVSSGGALARAPGVSLPKLPTIQVSVRAALAGIGSGERASATWEPSLTLRAGAAADAGARPGHAAGGGRGIGRDVPGACRSGRVCRLR